MVTRLFLQVPAVVLACLCATAARGASVVWSAAQGGNGHSYEVVLDGAASWSGARGLASASGGYLATEASAAEQQFIDAALASSDAPTGQYWIGLTQAGGNPFGWDDGEALVFSHWDA